MALQRLGARTQSMLEVAEFLRSAGLDPYIQTFEDLGYDDMEVLEQMDTASIANCIKAANDQTRFRSKQAQLRGKWRKTGQKAETNTWRSANTLIGLLSIVAVMLTLSNEMKEQVAATSMTYERDGDEVVRASPTEPQVVVPATTTSKSLSAGATGIRDVVPMPSSESDLDTLIVKRLEASFSYTRWTLDEAHFHHIHIPRVAGASWRNDVTKIIPTTAKYSTEEKCFGESSGHLAMVLFRKPLDQPLSIWQQCAHSSIHDWAKELIPENFSTWIEAWDAIRQDGVILAMCCASPVDMQSYRMSCPPGSITYGTQRRVMAEADYDLALANMKKAFFVGIMEAYDESFCLFEARVTGSLPKYCNCDDEAMWARRPQLSKKRDQKLNVSIYPETTLRQLSELTSKDAQLYNEALKRFLFEVRTIESRYGRRFLCKDLAPVKVPTPRPPAKKDSDETKKRLKHFLVDLPKRSKQWPKCLNTYQTEQPGIGRGLR